MQNERSGARKQHRKKDEEVLSAAESAAQLRGRHLKRVVRAAAALNELYDDVAIGEAVQVSRGAVGSWWGGAQMQPDTIRRLAEATGLSPDELTRFVYFDGTPPVLPSPAILPVLEGDRRARERLADTAQDTPSPKPARQTRDTGAGHE
jgi:hypothetical protein